MKNLILILLSLSIATGYTFEMVIKDSASSLLNMYREDTAKLFVESADEAYFDGRTLRGNSYSFRITNYEILEVGHSDNKSDTPIIVFYYDTYVNKSYDNSKDIIPDVLWPLNFTAYQDNDPNMLKPLDYGRYTGIRNENGSAKVKPGGKISGAYAYELSDTKTPVILVAGDLTGRNFGKHNFELNKVSKDKSKKETTTESETEVVTEEVTEAAVQDESAEAEYWSNLARQYGLEVYNPAGGPLSEYAAYVQSYIDSVTGYEAYQEDENGVLYENPIYDGRDGPEETEAPYYPPVKEVYEEPIVTEPPVTEPIVTEPPVTEPQVSE